jgi:peptidylprolyl isomerase
MAMQVNGAGAEKAAPPKPSTNGAAKSDFLKDFQQLPESRFRTTEDGLKIAVISEGSGKPIGSGMTLSVNYTGWTMDGTKFDSSMDRGKPFSFRLGGGTVIKGWEEGLAGMKPGEKRQIIVPAELAYGDRQVGKIPPGATLVFNVEAVSVEDAPGNPNGGFSVRA